MQNAEIAQQIAEQKTREKTRKSNKPEKYWEAKELKEKLRKTQKAKDDI